MAKCNLDFSQTQTSAAQQFSFPPLPQGLVCAGWPGAACKGWRVYSSPLDVKSFCVCFSLLSSSYWFFRFSHTHLLLIGLIIIGFWLFCVIMCTVSYCDWSLHNKYSWSISGVHSFLRQQLFTLTIDQRKRKLPERWNFFLSSLIKNHRGFIWMVTP